MNGQNGASSLEVTSSVCRKTAKAASSPSQKRLRERRKDDPEAEVEFDPTPGEEYWQEIMVEANTVIARRVLGRD